MSYFLLIFNYVKLYKSDLDSSIIICGLRCLRYDSTTSFVCLCCVGLKTDAPGTYSRCKN